MKILFTIILIMTSLSAKARKPLWTCFDDKVKYEIDWNSPEMETTDRAYVYTKDQKMVAYVSSITMWSPDIVFFDPNKGVQVILFLDTYPDIKKMYRFENGTKKELISELDCKFNY